MTTAWARPLDWSGVPQSPSVSRKSTLRGSDSERERAGGEMESVASGDILEDGGDCHNNPDTALDMRISRAGHESNGPLQRQR